MRIKLIFFLTHKIPCIISDAGCFIQREGMIRVAKQIYIDIASEIRCNAERNSLYKMIVESIIYQREGDNIEMKIDFA